MATYLLINLLAPAIPLVLSFDKKVHYYKRWKFLFPAIFITLGFFIIWDIIFTDKGIWGFNPLHLSGINIVNLPLEEWLFFITIPYSSIFLYDTYIAYFKTDYLGRQARGISIFLITFLSITALLSYDKAYTFLTFILLAFYIVLLQFILKVKYMGRFYFTFIFVLIPFLLVNGILTGSWIEE